MFRSDRTFLPGIMGMGVLVGGVRNLDGRRVGQRLGGGVHGRGSMSVGLDGSRGSIGGMDGSRGSMSVASVDGSRG
uniref:Uncharacterized protein n=1 Tax=Anopheles quadriannulatus TaxID=34691 RepID=A0A182XQZ8_ANOQN